MDSNFIKFIADINRAIVNGNELYIKITNECYEVTTTLFDFSIALYDNIIELYSIDCDCFSIKLDANMNIKYENESDMNIYIFDNKVTISF